MPLRSADVARAGCQGLNSGRRVVVTGLRNKLLVRSVGMSPRRSVAMVGRRFWERVCGSVPAWWTGVGALAKCFLGVVAWPG
jgi:hypothetical protein